MYACISGPRSGYRAAMSRAITDDCPSRWRLVAVAGEAASTTLPTTVIKISVRTVFVIVISTFGGVSLDARPSPRQAPLPPRTCVL